MIALRAPARARTGPHHQLRAVHTVLAAGAVRILAHGHQRLPAGGRLDASVAQIRVPARRGARRIAEEGGRGRVMMRERGRAGERRSERWILRQTGWAAQRISRESCQGAGLVRRQIAAILGVAARKDLHTGSDDRACSVVVVAACTGRSVGFLSIRGRLAIDDGRCGARRGRRLTRGRGRLPTDGSTISRRLFLRVIPAITRTHRTTTTTTTTTAAATTTTTTTSTTAATATTLLTTDTVNTSFGSRPTLVGGRLLRDNVSLVWFERQRFPVRRAAACTPFQLGGWWRFRIRTGIHAFGRFIQRGNQRFCR